MTHQEHEDQDVRIRSTLWSRRIAPQQRANPHMPRTTTPTVRSPLELPGDHAYRPAMAMKAMMSTMSVWR